MVSLIGGHLDVNGLQLDPGDAALLVAENQLQLAKGQGAEVLVFDLAA